VIQALAARIAQTLKLPEPTLGDAPEETFRSSWLPQVLEALPHGRKLVVLFDEFDVLAGPGPEAGYDPLGVRPSGPEPAGRTFFPYLSRLLGSDLRRLRFVFVIGRNVEDVDQVAKEIFKQTVSKRVSLLAHDDTLELVRLAEANATLAWTNEALTRVWDLTHGHPYLTQQLCSCVWAQRYDGLPAHVPEVNRALAAVPKVIGAPAHVPKVIGAPAGVPEVNRALAHVPEVNHALADVPEVTGAHVDAAVQEALETSRGALHWLWDGLPPAARMVASALAEAGSGIIRREVMEQRLKQSGVRILLKELREAPEILRQ
jgi:hypothetical protein